MNREDRDKSPPETDGWLSKGAIAAVAAAAGAAFALWATSPSEEEKKTQQPPRQTQPTRGQQTAPGTHTTNQTATNHVQQIAEECIICVDNPANVAFSPCGHKTFCEPCAQQIFQGNGVCPTCRGRITSVLRLYG
ncbi:hypothetical protein BV898_06244 [Hypsibius exemplaris]|uniref:RING-type domain-containing protein n=1 Tax=Hypsibius exemplaris TaxID=2072580 RepID=A0A1W0WWZ9_HYPEX|nr:hypothetical protein BV898_06244 [Hypsibius exemplaris]